jgi:hypothetical protein
VIQDWRVLVEKMMCRRICEYVPGMAALLNVDGFLRPSRGGARLAA